MAKSTEACCRERQLSSCFAVTIDPSILDSEQEININGLEFQFLNRVQPRGFTYHTDAGDEAVITYNQATKAMFGSVKTVDGKSYAIEKCHEGHVWKEFNMETFVAAGKDAVLEAPALPKGVKVENSQHKVDIAYDNTTVVDYSVMVHYTPQFAAITADIPGYVDQVLAETNQGYINSLIPVTISLLCIEAATIDDQMDVNGLITAYREMKGTVDALRNTADAAFLLVEDNNACGAGYLGTYSQGWTISFAQKSCALGGLTFGHEIGHNFGCHHDILADTNTLFSYGHGHHIAQGTASFGYRTILAYYAENHYTRANYYSNPAVILPATGTPTGVAGVSNNAAVITQNRFMFAALGDESNTCQETSGSTTTATTSSGTGSTTSSSSTGGCGNCVFPFLFNGRLHDSCTTIDGDNAWCSKTYEWSGQWEYCTDSSCPGTSATTTQQMAVNPLNAVGSCCKFFSSNYLIK